MGDGDGTKSEKLKVESGNIGDGRWVIGAERFIFSS
jgi:hypothetical protein